MEIKQNFVVSQPLPAVWSFFHDVPSVAECLPGAEYLGTKDDGSLSGKVSAKVGPFQASFEGEAKVRYDEDARRSSSTARALTGKAPAVEKCRCCARFFPRGMRPGLT